MKTPAPGKGGRLGQSSLLGSASEDTAPTRHSDIPAQPSLFDDVPADGDVLASRAQAEANCDDWWMSTALQAVKSMARTGRTFQCYDLVISYGTPEPDHANRWGALMTRAAREGIVEAVGAAPSRRPSTAKSLTRTWRGTR